MKKGGGLPFPIPIAKQGSGETFSNYNGGGSRAITEQTYSIYKNADLEDTRDVIGTKGRVQSDDMGNENSLEMDR